MAVQIPTLPGVLVVFAMGTAAAQESSANTPPVPEVASFIAIKELAHCAAFRVHEIQAGGLASARRERNIAEAGRFLAGAYRIDAAKTRLALRHAQVWMQAQPARALQARYRRMCAFLIESKRYRRRDHGWRYRIRAGQAVPPQFFEMKWDTPMPPGWGGPG